MTTESWTVIKNGVSNFFQADVEIIADFVRPCSYCGIACTGTFRLWYLDGNRRMTFETDDLSSLLDLVIDVAIKEDTYDLLPKFVRDYNECTGWELFDLIDGTMIEGDDILNTINLFESTYDGSDDYVVKMIAALSNIVRECVRDGRALYVGKT
jgi:hypothetical protein